VRVSASIMIKITVSALVAAAMLVASSAFAGDKACCVKGVSNTEKTACADLTALNLTPDQKTKIEAWQAECMKAGCTRKAGKPSSNRQREFFRPSSSLS